MQFLVYRALFRKKGLAKSIIAIALLVAILISAESIINHIKSEAQALGDLTLIGNNYLIINKDTTSITDKIDSDIINILLNRTDIKNIIPQNLIATTINTNSGNQTIILRRVEDIGKLLKLRSAYINGTVAKSGLEANIGVILARAVSISIGDQLKTNIDNKEYKVIISGIVTTHTQLDTELIVPIEAYNQQKNGDITLIEFTVQNDVDREEAISHITNSIPPEVKIVKVQQPEKYVYSLYEQTLTFLNIWSVAVYTAMIGTSYIVATALIRESNYELAMLRALGAEKRVFFTLVVTYTVTTAFLGSILGVVLGVTGPQAASTIFSWIRNIEISPFLETHQAIQTVMLAIASSTLGCIYPAFKFSNQVYLEHII